jgi:hypothetical protein
VASVPIWASTLIAAVTSAVRTSSARSWQASTSIPSIPSVPLISARPSFSASTTGSIPAAASAGPEGRQAPSRSRTSPSPMTASAQCASGARSPEHPSEPYSCTTGVSSALSRSAYAWAVLTCTPVRPVARVDSRSSIRARTTSVSTSGPEPAACERISPRCKAARCSTGMCLLARAPKPVETP